MNRRGFVAGATAAGFLPGAAIAQEMQFDRFSVVVRGSGPDVIFVPGLACGREVWAGVVAGLGGRCRVHLVQVAGFGGEPPGGNGQGDIAGSVAAGLAGYIAGQRPMRPAIVGHSMGGTIALMLAARTPDSIGRLMVVDMLPNLAAMTLGPNASPRQVQAAAAQVGDAMEHASDAAYAAALRARLGAMTLTASARPAIIQQGLASDRHVVARAMRELMQVDLRPELSRIVVPATVVYAWNAGYPYGAAQADALFRDAYATLRGVTLTRVDQSAHFVFLDQPDRFGARLNTFLAG